MKFALTLIILSVATFVQSQPNSDPADPILKSSRLDVIDSSGVSRIIIASPTPDPTVGGKQYNRDVTVTGITFNDNQGNELGGIGHIDGTRNSIFAFDYRGREAVVLYALDDSTHPGTGLVLYERVNSSEEDLKKPFGELGKSRPRLMLQVDKDIPTLSFLGKDGTARITIGLDSLDNPIIEVVGKDGKKRNLAE